MVYFNENYAEIVWDESHSIVNITFKGYMFSNQIHEVYESALKCLGEKKATKILVDARTYVTLKSEDQEWLMKEWLPKAVNMNVKKIARILPEKKIQRQVIDKLDQTLVKHFELKDFSSMEEGADWLNNGGTN